MNRPRKKTKFPAAAAVIVGACAPVYADQFFASQVISTVVGGDQPSAFSDPTQALGGPSGAGDYEGSLDVYKLGNGGSITLGFSGGAITNGPGADFIVFANPFYVSGNPDTDFAELSFVQVSTDGVHFVQFPTVSCTKSDPGAFGNINPANISGFAGVTPVIANTTPGGNDINPYDPSVAGGDAFDLSTLATLPAAETLEQEGYLNLNDIQYVRIVDVVDGVSTDSNGHIIYCPGSGADVDSVAVINGLPPPLTWDNAGAPTPADGKTWDINTNNNWNNNVSPAVYVDGSAVIFNDNNNDNYAVTLNTTVSPASVAINNSAGNYVISGSGSIAGSASLTKSGSATLTLSTSNTYSGGTTVNAGKLLIASTTALPASGPVSITGGALQLADNITAGTSFGSGGIALSSLSITGNGALDIGNNRIIIDYGSGPDPIASIQQWINNGYYNLGGPEIISSDIATDDSSTGFLYGIGYADGADGVISGLPSGEIEIMFTLLGDANLDGSVNAEDFTPFSHNIGQSGMSWDDGDFNYDGTVNAEDYTIFATNLDHYAALAAQPGVENAANFVSVPEPASASLLLAGASVILTRKRKKAFTLVELLVVVGIIAILVGLLLPTLAASREAAQSTQCQSNLQQLVTAAINYAGDYQGYWPPSSLNFLTADLSRWHGTRPTMNSSFNFLPSATNVGSCLYPYLGGALGTANIRACPDFVPDVTSGPAAYEADCGGYGYNADYIGSSINVPSMWPNIAGPLQIDQSVGNIPAKMNMIVHSSAKIAFADAAMGQAGNQLIEYSFVEPPNEYWAPLWYTSSPSIHFRHRNHANVAWADGHVTSELFTWTYPGLNAYGADNNLLHLGYFGPQDNSLFQRN
jgi:prepilin-type processing-associated H-X9-DG protein/prepilin-type N-terminal cleavage/methylation domain-containing protein